MPAVAQNVGFDVAKGDWSTTNALLGPGTTHRLFVGGALPAAFTADGTPSNVLIIQSYKAATSQIAIQGYLAGLGGRNVVIVYHHEPEGDYALGATFVSEFQAESVKIRAAAATLGLSTGSRFAQVQVWCASAGYPYRTAGTADVLAGNYLRGLAPYVDAITKDIYQGTGGASGGEGNGWPTNGLQNYSLWTNWYALATNPAIVGTPVPPIGLTEYGIGTEAGNANRNTRIQLDAAFLATITPQPVCWCYWYQSIDVNDDIFTDAPTIATWQAIESAPLSVTAALIGAGRATTPSSSTGSSALAGHGIASATASITTPGGGAAAFVQIVGTHQVTVAANTNVVTLGAGITTTAGNLLTLQVKMSGARTMSGVSDSKGNSWTVDQPGPGVSTGAAMASSICATPLTTGDTITASFSGTCTSANGVMEFSNPSVSGINAVPDLKFTSGNVVAAHTNAETATFSVATGEIAISCIALSSTTDNASLSTTADTDSGGTWVDKSAAYGLFSLGAAYQIGPGSLTKFFAQWTEVSGTSNCCAMITTYQAATVTINAAANLAGSGSAGAGSRTGQNVSAALSGTGSASANAVVSQVLPRCIQTGGAGGGGVTSITPTLVTGSWTNAAQLPSGNAPAVGDLVILAGSVFANGKTTSQQAVYTATYPAVYGGGTWNIQFADTDNVNAPSGESFVAWRIWDGTESDPTFIFSPSGGRVSWAAIAIAPDAGSIIGIDSWGTALVDAAATAHTPNPVTATGRSVLSLIITNLFVSPTGTTFTSVTPPAGWIDLANSNTAGTSVQHVQATDIAFRAGMNGTITPGADTISQSSATVIYHIAVSESPFGTVPAAGALAGQGAIKAVTSIISATATLHGSGSISATSSGMARSNTALGGINGTAVTIGNSGGTSGDHWDAVATGTASAVIYDNTHAIHGLVSYKLTTAAAVDTLTLNWTPSGGPWPTLYSRVDCYLTAYPSSDTTVAQYFTTGGVITAQLRLTSAGLLKTINASGATAATGAIPVPLNQSFRLGFDVTGSAAAGVITARQYAAVDSVTVTETLNSTSQNTAGVLTSWSAGYMLTSSGASSVIWMDDLALTDAGPLGPFSGSGALIAGSGQAGAVPTLRATAALAGTGVIRSQQFATDITIIPGLVSVRTWATFTSTDAKNAGASATRQPVIPGATMGNSKAAGLIKDDAKEAGSVQGDAKAAGATILDRGR